MCSIRSGVVAASFMIVAVFANGSLANDTLAVFGAGGLRFERTDELQIKREDLFLSPDEVRVEYVIRNLSAHEVHGTVAFPMPDIDVAAMSETPHQFHPSANDGDIFDFHVDVDGRPIMPEFEAKALMEGKDITDLLKQHGVSVVAPDDRRLKREDIAALTAAGAFFDDDEHHPHWIVKPIYHWIQVFPAERELSIAHRYRPVLGGTQPPIRKGDSGVFESEYCPDDAFLHAVQKLPRRQSDQTVDTRWLEYVLKTGANWAGPIERFHLEIGKADADLISLCPIPGLKLERHGRAFVADVANYVPVSDIKILFVYGCGRLRRCD
jgi:Domain of unknown function (DUF4424)